MTQKSEKIKKMLQKSKEIDFEYMKTRMYELEQKNTALEDRLDKVQKAVIGIWADVQNLYRTTSLTPESDVEDLIVSEDTETDLDRRMRFASYPKKGIEK